MSQDDSAAMFTRISDPIQKDRLAEDLIRLKTSLICKESSYTEIFHMNVSRRDSAASLICVRESPASVPVAFPADVIISFTLGSERYFMNTRIADLGGGYFEVQFSADVFHLQRRQNYRIRLPAGHDSAVQITRHGRNAVKWEALVLDVSSGGLRIALPPEIPDLAPDERLEGDLRVGGRPALPFKARVRHGRREKLPSPRQTAGIEFTDVSTMMENKLFSITMELNREILTRWK